MIYLKKISFGINQQSLTNSLLLHRFLSTTKYQRKHTHPFWIYSIASSSFLTGIMGKTGPNIWKIFSHSPYFQFLCIKKYQLDFHHNLLIIFFVQHLTKKMHRLEYIFHYYITFKILSIETYFFKIPLRL